MTKKEIIYKAADLLETKKEWWSCNAVDRAEGENYCRLRREYAEFYDKEDDSDDWGFAYNFHKRGRNQRIIALLLFAEVKL